MAEFYVNVYIETSVKGPAVREAAGEWLVEYITSTGVPVTRGGILWKEKTTRNAITLELLREALSILKKTCSIRVFTQSEHILNTVNNHRLPQWEKRGWINAKGKPVGNLELWQQVYALMGNHFLEVTSEWHEYQAVMQHDIRKEIKKRHDKT